MFTSVEAASASAPLLSIPYKPRGRNPDDGFDCVGLAIHWFSLQGVNIPDPVTTDTEAFLAHSVMDHFSPIEDEDAQLNDVAAYTNSNGGSHLAIILGDRAQLTTSEGTGVFVMQRPVLSWTLRGYFRLKR